MSRHSAAVDLTHVSTDHPPARTLWRARKCDRIIIAAMLAAAALFLFVDVRPAPITLWDESRTIVNALEMHRTGWGIVTTYDGAPDLWNTKPPLLIWLMSGSVALFGASEAALRLPSTLASLGTLLLLMLFVRRSCGSAAAAMLAATLLTLSPGFFDAHGARTADYDALLAFFCTAYLTLVFALVHRRRPSVALLALAGALVVGAVLTKGVAGLTPLAGVPIHLALRHRAVRALRTTGLAPAAATAAGVLMAYLLLREAAAPGYLAAMWYNDVGGRFTASLIGTAKPWYFYLDQLAAGYMAGGVLLLAAPLALAGPPSRARLALGYALTVSATLLVIISVAGSKLSHYLLPVLPMMAAAIAIGLHGLAARLHRRYRALGAVVLLLVLLPAVRQALAIRYDDRPVETLGGSSRYGELFAALPLGIEATVIDPGFTLEGRPHYAAVLLAYREIAGANGQRIGHVSNASTARTLRGIVASCDPATADDLHRIGRDVAGVPGCAAIRR